MRVPKPCSLFVLAQACWLMAATQMQAQNRFTRGPFVQNATTNSIQVIWHTANPASTCVAYGATPALDRMLTNSALATEHVVTLSGLAPGATYYYQVLSENSSNVVFSATEPFRTLKAEGPVSFAFISDTAEGHPVTPLLVQRIKTGDPDLVVHGGDLVYFDFKNGVGAEYFAPFQPLIKTTPVFPIAGNHDCFQDPDATNFQNTFYLPTNTATGTELFYSFDHGDVHFVCLFNPWFATYVFTNGSTQYNWLTNDLASSAKPWKLLFSHFPAATASYHAGDNANGGPPDQYEVMSLLAPVARQYGVQMLFSGHDHAFQRFAPTNGLHCIVNGSGGQSPYSFTTMHYALEQFWTGYAFTRVQITNDTLWLQAVDTNGVAFDSMTVQRALPPRQLYQAAWHTPQIDAGPANDNDGNRINQRFDFRGAPMFPRAGQIANLGQVFVNNDATNLYLGFREVMIYPDNNVFLFIDSPRLAGASSMAGIGDGLINPLGQGADGLDCLENLAFTNFAPALGCLLGDEYADGQFRSFARSNLALNIGQGAFYLDTALSDVPGILLQQFNRSPQIGPISSPVNLEQNADIIQLAIPLQALGGVQPGELIKLGALVGGREFDPAAQTRWLDTACLGYSLVGAGQASVLLEGVSVQLATEPAAVRLTLSPASPTQYLLTWNALVGKTYEIEYSTGSLTNFQHLATLTAPAATTTYPLTPPAGNLGFFRVKQVSH